MGFVRELKEFAIRGNFFTLSVGIIMGASFGKIVSSLIEDVITPLLLNPALRAAGVEKITQLTWKGVTYGSFLSAVLSFFCITIILFSVVKLANKINKQAEDDPANLTEDQKLLTEIRDLLKNKNI